MRTRLLRKINNQPWTGTEADNGQERSQLVLFFGLRASVEDEACFNQLKQAFPAANIVGCSTGGQIVDDNVADEIATGVAINFDATDSMVAQEVIKQDEGSYPIGRRLATALAAPALRHVLVLSDGLHVNGSELVRGMVSVLGKDVSITGGLAGDGSDFTKTLVAVNGPAIPGQIAAVGLYGTKLVVGHGSAGGWNKFGPKRRITKATGNILVELDGKPALDLYKTYLGDEADALPGSALLYPLLVSDPDQPEHSLVRTVLSVDHGKSTMTFAGDIPEGWSAQLMRGYFDRLAEGAGQAARSSIEQMHHTDGDRLSILVSCIGRRLLMGENIVDEISAARMALGEHTRCLGFYSYGEIAPHARTGCSELHNQTMSVTTLSEAA